MCLKQSCLGSLKGGQTFKRIEHSGCFLGYGGSCHWKDKGGSCRNQFFWVSSASPLLWLLVLWTDCPYHTHLIIVPCLEGRQPRGQWTLPRDSTVLFVPSQIPSFIKLACPLYFILVMQNCPTHTSASPPNLAETLPLSPDGWRRKGCDHLFRSSPHFLDRELLLKTANFCLYLCTPNLACHPVHRRK